MRRIYSEFVPWDVLDRPLLAALGRHHVDQIAVAVMPHDVHRLPALALRCRDEDIRLAVWPLVGDEHGRWVNGHNRAPFEALIAQILRDVPASTMLLDLEPPIDWTRRAVEGRVWRRPRAARVKGSTTQPLQHGPLHGMSAWLRREGWRVEAVVPPMLSYGERWAKHLNTPLEDVGASAVEAMAYTSLFQGYGGGLVDREVARDLLARISRRASGVALGVVGGGALGSEQAYRGAEELEEDVAIVRGAGVERLSLYGLDGVLERGPIEPWLDAFRAEPSRKKPRRTLRGAALERIVRLLG